VTVTCHSPEPGWAAFDVQDTGLGIAEENLPHLFDRLYQVPKDRIATSHRGLGLGLHISRNIVQAHGGRMCVHSTPGAGSTFTFTLPIAA
jgi:signal transduction histidine kinase